VWISNFINNPETKELLHKAAIKFIDQAITKLQKKRSTFIKTSVKTYDDG
jgi:hypothetical protein